MMMNMPRPSVIRIPHHIFHPSTSVIFWLTIRPRTASTIARLQL
jgi:hypothetical protein